MVDVKLKSMIKTGVLVAIIYMVAVMLSLFLCDRMSELESRQDQTVRNERIVLHLK